MAKKNLLVISLGYPCEKLKNNSFSFVKDQIDMIKKEFNRVYVICPTPFFPKILSKSNIVPYHLREKALRENYTYDNVEVIYTKFLTLPSNFFNKRNGDLAYFSVNKAIKKRKINFDMIHCHFTWYSGYVGKILKKRYKKKVIVTAHGFDIYDLPFRNDFWNNKVKEILKSCNHIITVSKFNFQKIKKLGFEKKTIIIPNCYDEEIFFPKNKIKCRKKLNLPINKKIIINVGNLIPLKNQETLILAINEIVKKRKEILCLIIGEGELKKKLQEKINELNLNEHVKLLGSKKHEEISDYMNSSDLFVFPSLKESFGIVQIEAMGCKVPVLASKNGGSVEIISSKELGFLYENTKDYKELAEKIIIGLNSKLNLKRIQNYAYENFSKKIIKNKLIEILK
jgi:glycosyltransferase involved in cell wall biosynthesis